MLAHFLPEFPPKVTSLESTDKRLLFLQVSLMTQSVVLQGLQETRFVVAIWFFTVKPLSAVRHRSVDTQKVFRSGRVIARSTFESFLWGCLLVMHSRDMLFEPRRGTCLERLCGNETKCVICGFEVRVYKRTSTFAHATHGLKLPNMQS